MRSTLHLHKCTSPFDYRDTNLDDTATPVKKQEKRLQYIDELLRVKRRVYDTVTVLPPPPRHQVFALKSDVPISCGSILSKES